MTLNADEATISSGTPEKDWLHLGSRYCFPFVSSPPTNDNDENSKQHGQKSKTKKPRRKGNTKQDQDCHLGHRYAFPFLSSPPVSPTRSERRRQRRLRQRRAKRAQKTTGDASGYKHPVFPALCSPLASPSVDSPADSQASGGDAQTMTRKLRVPPPSQNRHPIFALSSPPTSVDSREDTNGEREKEMRRKKKNQPDAGSDTIGSPVTPMRPNRHPLVFMCPDAPQSDDSNTKRKAQTNANGFGSSSASNNKTDDAASVSTHYGSPCSEEYHTARRALSRSAHETHDQNPTKNCNDDKSKQELRRNHPKANIAQQWTQAPLTFMPSGRRPVSSRITKGSTATAIHDAQQPTFPEGKEKLALAGTEQKDMCHKSSNKSISSHDTPFPQADDDNGDYNHNEKQREDNSISGEEEEEDDDDDDDDDDDGIYHDDDDDDGDDDDHRRPTENQDQKPKIVASKTIWHLDSDSDSEDSDRKSVPPPKTTQKKTHCTQSSAAKTPIFRENHSPQPSSSSSKKRRVDRPRQVVSSTPGTFYIGSFVDDSDDDEFLLRVFTKNSGKRKAPLDNRHQTQKYAKHNDVAKRGSQEGFWDDSGDDDSDVFPRMKPKKAATPPVAHQPPGKRQYSSLTLQEKAPEEGLSATKFDADEESQRENTLLLEEYPEFIDVAVQLNLPKIIPSRPHDDMRLRR